MDEKIDWIEFGVKAWNGISLALKEEVIEKTTNKFDDSALAIIDMAVNTLATHLKK